MNGIKVLDRPASQSFYAVAGRLLFVQNSDPSLAARIEQLFSGWQLTPVSSPERSHDIKIGFFSGFDLPEIPSPLSLTQFDIADSGRLYSGGDFFYLKFDNSLLHVEPCKVTIWLKEPLRLPDAELARVTSFAVCSALRRFGLFELHSAAVAIPETGSGVLLIGSSGSGKSTLTSQLARAGWGYLSDDEVLLSLGENEVEARGFRSFFALSNDGPSKHCFEPGEVFNSHRMARAIPRYLLFTSVQHDDKTQLHELTQSETMSRLIRACPWATYDTLVAAPYLEILSKLARQTKGIDLKAGTDLLDASEASRIISSVCH